MDVDRPVAREADDRRKFAGVTARRRMRRDADARQGSPHSARHSSTSRANDVEIVDEAPLLGTRRRAAEGRVGVEHRQQRQPDAGRRAAATMRSAISARRA